MTPRARVILDNDFGGDPDGLFQLAHHLLSGSVDVRLVIASKIPDSFAAADPGVVARGVASADRIFTALGRDQRAIAGSETGLVPGVVPPLDGAARAVIDEAMRDDTDLPLYYCAGGGLTALATALLHEPQVAGRLTVVWIGGSGYDDDGRPAEFNATIDAVAAGVVFASPAEIWQVPETTYEQCLVSSAELEHQVAPLGPLAAHLVATLREFADRFAHMLGANLGETVVLGDSPLVLLTALRGPFQAEPTSSPSHTVPRRTIGADARYGDVLADRPPVRVFTGIDMRLTVGDMIAKFAGAGA
ncbi:nucleoside hydrolase [Microbacterium sp.]|uniref:nucleoside hydrolase n=1 Tax=Microbacterium sp. TaxID=51671 RepID=UPI003A912B31